MKKIDKQKEIYDFLDTIKNDDSAFVLYFFEKSQLLNNRFPDIKSFEDYLSTFKKRLGDKRKNEMRAFYEKENTKRSIVNKNGFVMNFKVPDVLGIEKDVYQKIYKKGAFIAPAGMEGFEKWGKYLETPYFNYDEILKFKAENLPVVLEQLGFTKKIKLKEDFQTVCEKLNEQLNGTAKLFTYYDIKDPFDAVMTYHNVEFEGLKFILYVVKNNPMRLRSYKGNSVEELNNIIQKVIAVSKKELIDFEQKVKNEIDIGLYSVETFLKKIRFNFKQSAINKFDISSDDFKALYDDLLKVSFLEREGSRLEKLFDLKNYHNTFPLARNIVRNINVICGPTNSGKTYEAIEALKNAHSGVYLAPLRLMALEVFDKLNAAGVPCSLKTGDSEIVVPGAKHIASTVECLDLSQFYEVAVIDEFQMLADFQRGWAWTQAILGVCAQNIYLIGNKSAVNITKKVLSYTDDVISIKEMERNSQLNIVKVPVEVKDIQAGDAVIVFSRNGVIEWAEALKDMGKSVSLIYGSLAPEVRRKQAEMFLNGETEVLVSTDAIGMGLNLPIKRVLFTTLEKYNGESVQYLTSTEIKQIAGRAGRYKEDGYVGVINGNHQIESRYDYWGDIIFRENKSHKYLSVLRNGLAEKDKDISILKIVPNSFHINELSKALETNSILRILEGFNYTVKSDTYIPTFFNNADDIVEACGDSFLNLDLMTQYNLINTPLDLKGEMLERCATIINYTFFRKEKTEISNWINVNAYYMEFMEEELKMLTALNHISKQTTLIDMKDLDEVRETLSNKIIEELMDKFKQSPQKWKDYMEARQRKIEREEEKKRVKMAELNALKLELEKLIPSKNATEEERTEIKRARKKINKKLEILRCNI